MLEAEEILDEASRDCDLDAVFIVCVDDRDHPDVVIWTEKDFSEAPWNCATVDPLLVARFGILEGELMGPAGLLRHSYNSYMYYR